MKVFHPQAVACFHAVPFGSICSELVPSDVAQCRLKPLKPPASATFCHWLRGLARYMADTSAVTDRVQSPARSDPATMSIADLRANCTRRAVDPSWLNPHPQEVLPREGKEAERPGTTSRQVADGRMFQHRN